MFGVVKITHFLAFREYNYCYCCSLTRYLAGAAAVELAEFPGAGSVVVRGIFLDIAELEQLDVLIDGDLAKGIGPHHREYIWTDKTSRSRSGKT